MFSMLQLEPDVSSSQCEDLLVLQLFIDDHGKVADLLINIINNQILKSSHKSSCEWLCAIPLIHMLKNKVEPFQKPAFTSKEIQWSDSDLHLGHLTKKSSFNVR